MAPLLNMRLRVAEPTMSFPYSKLHTCIHSLRAATPQDQTLLCFWFRFAIDENCACARQHCTIQRRSGRHSSQHPCSLTLAHVAMWESRSRRWMEGIVVATSPNPMWLALGLLLVHGRNFRDETTSALWTVDGDPSQSGRSRVQTHISDISATAYGSSSLVLL